MSSAAQGHTLLCEHWHSKWVSWSSLPLSTEITPQNSQFEAPQHKTDTDILDGASLTDHQDDQQAEAYSVWRWRCLLSLRTKGDFRGEISFYSTAYWDGKKKTKSNSFKLFLELNHPLMKGNWQYQQHRKFWLDTEKEKNSEVVTYCPGRLCPWRYSKLDWIWPAPVRFDFKGSQTLSRLTGPNGTTYSYQTVTLWLLFDQNSW